MAATATESPRDLAVHIGSFVDDPLGYVAFAFPWNTAALPWPGPDAWQVRTLERIGELVRERAFDRQTHEPVEPIRIARGAARGVGKGALLGMVACWIMDTRPYSRGVISANTKSQVRGKTFPELVKWRRMSITSDWWEILTGDMAVRHIEHPEQWRCDCITWDKHNAEAFAGLHAATSTGWYAFDECSNIPREILEVAEGGMTDGEPMMLLWGNRTRSSGYFHECFGRMLHRWDVDVIDGRTSRHTNKRQLQQWIDDYGIHSDFVRVNVLGLEPLVGFRALIGGKAVEVAMLREPPQPAPDEPIVAGLDVARFGEDESVLAIRQGGNANIVEWGYWRSLGADQLQARCAEKFEYMRTVGVPIDVCFVDAGGVGGPVADNLRAMGWPIVEVNFGGKPERPDRYRDRGAETWARMRDWIELGALPDDRQLSEQLTAREYGHTDKLQVYLESKDDLRDRGEPSPDRGDALALTFASVVSRNMRALTIARAEQEKRRVDWDPFREV